MKRKIVLEMISFLIWILWSNILYKVHGLALPDKYMDNRRNVSNVSQATITFRNSYRENSSFSDILTSKSVGAPQDYREALWTKTLQFAGGMVSVDCLRCLCLKLSNCEPIGCTFSRGTVVCGYFQLTKADVLDCKVDSDWERCANDIMCSSLCVQRYMELYVKPYNCVPSCEAYARELYGGPNGCNNPRTLPFWNAVQKVPGCKGVM